MKRAGKKQNHNEIISVEEDKRRKSNKNKNCSRSMISKQKQDINKFSKIKTDVIGHIVSFFSISDCFSFMKMDKRSREIIIHKHKPFPLFVSYVKRNTIAFEDIFEDRYSEYTIKNELIDTKLRYQLNYGEAETMLENLIIHISKNKTILKITEENAHLWKYIKILLTNHYCTISDFHCEQINDLQADERLQGGFPHFGLELGKTVIINKSIQKLTIFNFELKLMKIESKLSVLVNTSLPEISVGDFNFFFSLVFFLVRELSLKTLIFLNSSIDRDIHQILLDGLKDHKTIKELNFSNCIFVDNSLISLDFFKYNTITHLIFDSCSFNRSTLDNFFLKKTKKTLYDKDEFGARYISFWNCELSKKEIDMITQILDKTQMVVSLSLGGFKIPRLSIPALINIIKNNKCLVLLELSKLELSNQDFIEICDALLHNNTLTWVDLSENNISDRRKLFELLKVNKTLKVFILTENEINSEDEELVNKIISEKNKKLK